MIPIRTSRWLSLRVAVGVGGILLLALASPGCALIMPDSFFPEGEYGPFETFTELAPATGERAPPFALVDLDGHEVALDDLSGQPLLLIVGSYTCPMFRFRQRWIRDLTDDYAGRAHVVIIYATEIHPVGSPSPATGAEWDVCANLLGGVRLGQPPDLAARRERAIYAKDAMDLETLVLIDGMDNAVWDAYGRGGAPAYVIDSEGRIVHRRVWIEPDEIRVALDQLLDPVPAE